MSTVITGIYSITNLTNGKRYIGKSLSIHSRWSQHRRDLKKGIHHSGFLQNAWNKYGEDSFKFEVIEKCDKEFLSEREIHYIEFYKSLYKDFGYNLHDTTKAVSIGEVKNIPTRRVYQIDNTNTIVKIWNSSRDVCEFLNIDMKKFHKIFYGVVRSETSIRVSYKGFVWVYESDYDESINYFERISKKGKKFESWNKPVIAVNSNKEIVHKFTTTQEGADFFNKPLANFACHLFKGKIIDGLLVIRESKYDETKDYFAPQRRCNNSAPVKTIKNILTGDLYNFTSYRDAAKELDLNPKKLAFLIKGEKSEGNGKVKKINTYKGWERF